MLQASPTHALASQAMVTIWGCCKVGVAFLEEDCGIRGSIFCVP